MLKAMCHSAEGWRTVADLSTISDLLETPTNLLWAEANVADVDPGEIELIADEFSLHPLAIEDALNTRQRPKFEIYESHIFLVFHQLDEVEGQLEARQIACFLGSRFVITIHDDARRMLDEAHRRWSEDHETLNHPSRLIHTLLDVTVDDYQEIADALEEEVEEMEEIALRDPSEPMQRRLYSLKQRLARLRRYALPAQRLLHSIVDPEVPKPFSAETAALFRDIDDHLLRITDQIRNVDDLAEAILNLQRSEQATALNEVTKRLTGWAAIIAVPTFIASVYGMNFALVPSEGQEFGFWFAVALMVVSGLTLFAFFRRRGWI